MRPMMRVIAKRVAVAVAAFVAVHTWVSVRERESYGMQQWIVRQAKAAGCQPIFESRGMMWGPDGPFFGEDSETRVFNFLAKYGPWSAALSAGFVGAIAVYGATMGLERSRVLGYRGETRCGWCGYGLKGLKEARCPECGRGI